MPEQTGQQQTNPIKPNQAVKAAADYFVQTVGEINEQTAVAVEGLEMSTDRTKWLVTLSHRDPLASTLYTLYPGNDARLYKEFTVDAFTGEVISMKAKKL